MCRVVVKIFKITDNILTLHFRPSIFLLSNLETTSSELLVRVPACVFFCILIVVLHYVL